ncbi:MAG: YdcF family protein [Kiritimatiellales bacterium]|nr:YdcF family protein [Kiritimatiellales bacterium]
MNFRLIRKRSVYTPTWLGGLLVLLLAAGTLWIVFTGLYPFLAQDAPPHEGLFVVEGWMPDYALDEALAIYRNGNYEKIVATGTPIETGSALLKWESLAQMTTARLIEMGVEPAEIVTAIGHDVLRDRTYASAMAMKESLVAAGIAQTNIHLISVGPHGRRSCLIYRKALGKNYRVGITCLETQSYAANRWWTSSNGVRSVISELIAWLYAKFLFHP